VGFLNQTKRVELEDGEWVEVKTLSIGALRSMRRAAATVEVLAGEDKDEVQGYELSQRALEACIVAWSDPTPVSPEAIADIPYAVMFKLTAAIGLGEAPAPLPGTPPDTSSTSESGPASPASSTDSPAE